MPGVSTHGLMPATSCLIRESAASAGSILLIRGRDLIVLFESPVHYPRKEAWNQVNKNDYEVDAFDLLFVDCSQGVTEGALLTEDTDQVTCLE